MQVAYEDAEAYARWCGKDLPTEAEWEFAARGGLEGAEFAGATQLSPGGQDDGEYLARGIPWDNSAARGSDRTSPVGAFPANGYGLHDMAGMSGNGRRTGSASVTPRMPRPPAAGPRLPAQIRAAGPLEASYDPAQPQVRIPRKVVKGGSFLCAANYCRRYRPAARPAQMIDSGMSHIGFRCISRRGIGGGEGEGEGGKGSNEHAEEGAMETLDFGEPTGARERSTAPRYPRQYRLLRTFPPRCKKAGHHKRGGVDERAGSGCGGPAGSA